MKIEAALLTNNSPYAEVRAVVDNKDDPNMPSSTIRCWFIGILFCAIVAFINGFFEPHFPPITISGQVPQLLAYPVGVFMANTLPDWGFTLFGVRHSLNPGPFNRKEHMLITIMCNAYNTSPYTNWIVWIQFLPTYFNQHWALNFGYQLCIALSTGFIGYGFAGITRRFIVYPTHCVWPSSLVIIALNSAFHSKTGDEPVMSPFKKMWSITRIRFFLYAFFAMFFYHWIPNTVFGALSTFSWMSWINPYNKNLVAITSANTGLGLNPVPTFNWNYVNGIFDPLYMPSFSSFNMIGGAFATMFVVIGLYYSNAFNTSYIPITSNLPYDRFGLRYNVTRVLDKHGKLDVAKYNEYSKPYLSAGNITVYIFFFSVYTATITYTLLRHRHEIWHGIRGAMANIFKSNDATIAETGESDVHMRHMKKYKEVPEWWYLTVLLLAAGLGMAAVAVWPTGTSPAVVVYGMLLCAIFVIPIGIIYSMTGTQVLLNVLAEFIGGAFSGGNAVSMCFFKTYGYLTCAQALNLAQDLKQGHYVKIPPRIMFWAQMVPTFVSTFLFVGLLQYQIHIDKICTKDAPFHFLCPNENTFFTAAVTWGTVGPARQFGAGGPYSALLVGFPLGIFIVLAFWGLGKLFPKSSFVRTCHPVILISGALFWAPYNLTYFIPAISIAWYSWHFVRTRYLPFWSKYNYVLSAAFSAGVALSSLIQFFAIAIPDKSVDWAGNNVVGRGCEGEIQCTRFTLAPGESFAPKPGAH